nr:EOG090X08O3 [Eulimnadia texana]
MASLPSYHRTNAGDEAVMATNDDASNCKRHAIQLGYWNDKYLPFFVRNAERKAPEISRGYFARVQGILRIVRKFVDQFAHNCQIVNLGAGFDTLYWRLKGENRVVKNFVELDFPHVLSRKCHYVKTNSALLSGINDPNLKFSASELHAADFHMTSADLRNFSLVENKLKECGIDFAVPTLFIAECVLVYMKSSDSRILIKDLAEKFEKCVFVNYEQANMNDKFGQVMMNNLKTRGCELAGIDDCLSLDTQENRFIDNGWDGASALDMLQVYHLLPKDEINRVEKIEFLDEVELLQQLLEHYCMCIAWKGLPEFSFQTVFDY